MKLDFRTDGRGEIHIHREGCADPRQAKCQDLPAMWTADAVSRQEAVLNVYPPDDFNYDRVAEWQDFLGDLHFYPCTAELADEGIRCERCKNLSPDIDPACGLCPACETNNEGRVIL